MSKNKKSNEGFHMLIVVLLLAGVGALIGIVIFRNELRMLELVLAFAGVCLDFIGLGWVIYVFWQKRKSDTTTSQSSISNTEGTINTGDVSDSNVLNTDKAVGNILAPGNQNTNIGKQENHYHTHAPPEAKTKEAPEGEIRTGDNANIASLNNSQGNTVIQGNNNVIRK